MHSEGNSPKNGEPTAGFSFTTMLHHTGWFYSRVSLKEHCDNTGTSPYSPDVAAVDFCLFPRLISVYKGRHVCDATNIKNVMEELKTLSQHGFQECFQHMAEVYCCQSGIF
jgi:hypothetical protein